MKKILSIIAVLTLIFTSCNKCDECNMTVGGRYFGTFHNQSNKKSEIGNLLFKYDTCDCQDIIVNDSNHMKICDTFFFMNNLLKLQKTTDYLKWKILTDSLTGDPLKNLLKTMPAIDSIQVCDSAATIIRLDKLEVEFKSSSVKTIFQFFTTNEKDSIVTVEFVGYNE